jgi:hypothetical protein
MVNYVYQFEIPLVLVWLGLFDQRIEPGDVEQLLDFKFIFRYYGFCGWHIQYAICAFFLL